MKKSLLTFSLICSAQIFSYSQKKMTCIDSLLTNPEYSNDKNFMKEVSAKRAHGISDREIYNEYNAEQAKKNKAFMDAANEQFIKDFILPKNKKGTSVNSYSCIGDSLGIINGSFGNWKGFTMGWSNTGGCNTAPWTPTPLPCCGCVANASGGSNNICIAPPPTSDPCADAAMPIQLPSPYGGNYSIQLGNSNTNAQQERVTYSFIVTSNDVFFNYQYAAVLNDPAHVPANQPFFDFVILGPLGDTVPSSYQHYVAAPSLGWQTSNQSNPSCNPNAIGSFVYYKPWTIVGVNLNAYVGKQVTVVATVADCSQCGHFGYAYLDFSCPPCPNTVANIDSIKNTTACLGGNDGAIYISDSTTAGPLTYSWSNGATTQDITGLSVGSYSVAITDTNNCTTVLNINVNPPVSTISIHIDSLKNTSCNGNTGAIAVSASGGNSPYSYSWSNGATTQYISGLAVGNYTVTVTDAGGCTNSITAIVSYPNPVFASTSSTPDSCSFNSGSANCIATGGIPPYTYLWSNGSTNQFIAGLSSGNYTVTVTDSKGCTVMSMVNVPLIPAHQPSICMVTVDSLSKNNIIMWDKTSFNHIDSFIVFREITSNNYQPIGAIPYDSLSLFTDTVRTKYFPNTGDPNAGTYRYKIGVSDSCGNKSTLSLYHNTIFIVNNSGAFTWSQPYTIENSASPVNGYVLMRDDNSTGAWHAVNSVSGTQQTVVDPNFPTYQSTGRWRVETQWNIVCNPTRINPMVANYNSSRSNIFSNVNAVNEIDLSSYVSVYPNPSDGKFQISGFRNLASSIEIYNVYGEKIYSSSINASNAEINLADKCEGIYFLQLKISEGIAIKKIILSR